MTSPHMTSTDRTSTDRTSTGRSRAGELVARLSVAQKAALCLGADYWHTAAVPEAGLEPVMVSDGPHGLRKQPGAFLSPGLPATCFPTASALGSCWDADLVREVGAAIGAEASAADVGVLLGPGVNIKRSPLCGRNYEYFAEDPCLAGQLAAAMVDGIQSRGVGACVKHFAANNQETDRLRVSADADERTLREIYLAVFERIVTTARPWLVMSAYNKVNGVFMAQNRWLLTDVLRDEWGFDGVVSSDWGSVHDRVAALEAGLDLEMPPNFGISDRAIIEAVGNGTLPEAVLDRAAERVARLLLRTRARRPAELDTDAHHALARRAAAASMVLLKNQGEVLPLADRPGLTVAVIGEFARAPYFQGVGSSEVTPLRVDTPLEELGRALPSATFRFASGYPLGRDAADAATLAVEARRAADGADVVVAFLGLPPGSEVEGIDRTHIDLPAVQTELVRLLAEGGTPVVAVLFNGSVVRTSTWDDRVSAIVECWLAGQAVGAALADVLTGAVNPSGRLAETIPLRLEDTPSYLNFPGEEGSVRYGERVFVGYRGYDATGREVAYPFGHGLTYTRFGYADLEIARAGLGLTVACTVANTGPRAGHEVVQLYIGVPRSRVARPPRELKAFTRIALAPGATRRVCFTVSSRDLSYWSSRRGWTLEPGEFIVEVGASSRDIRLAQSVVVEAEQTGTRERPADASR
jgi:beta-glucosidase